LRFAPAPQNQGRNWNTPSSPEIPAKVMPLEPALVTFSSAAFRPSHVVSVDGSTPALSRMSLL
jgi:hypothetical protein